MGKEKEREEEKTWGKDKTEATFKKIQPFEGKIWAIGNKVLFYKGLGLGNLVFEPKCRPLQYCIYTVY